MPSYEMQAPDGKKYRVEGPAGATDDQVRAEIIRQNPSLGGGADQQEQPPGEQKPLTAGEVATGAVKNLPGSAVEFGKSMVQPFIHPVETAESFYNLGAGILEKAGIKSGEEHKKYADAVGKFFADRYGGVENVKRTIATDPVGMLADLSTVMSGGGTAAARTPGIVGKIGEVARTAGRITDPINIASKGVGVAARAAAKPIGVMTGTGDIALRTAEQAGYQGGESARAFRENITGREATEVAVNEARNAVKQIRQERGAAYRAGTGKVLSDPTILDFTKIDNALADISQVKTYKGQIIDTSTQAIRGEIGAAIRDWKMLNPAEFHTVEGLDALKQKIGSIRDATQYGTPERVVADRAYHAIRDTINAQAPEYAKVMKGYEEASKQIKELENTLAGKPNSSIDTALRKLQATLRDNVNTAYGRRRELAQYLVDHGAPHLMERLAGQALHSAMPRGLSRLLWGEIVALGGGAAAGAHAAGVAGAAGGAGLAAIPALASMSPRLMGETFYGIGGGRRALEATRPTGATFQAGRIARQLDPRQMIQEDAKQALRDKKDFTADEIKLLREVSRGEAKSDRLMQAKGILERRSAKQEEGGSPLKLTVRPSDAPTYQGPL